MTDSDEPDYQALMAKCEQAAKWADMELSFRGIFHLCRHYTMTSAERMYDLYKSVEYIIKAEIPGAFVECGVWKGGSAMVIAATLQQMGVSDREIILFDTFEGHVNRPQDNEVDIFGTSGAVEFDEHKAKGESWGKAAAQEVVENLMKTGYNGTIEVVMGPVEETLASGTDFQRRPLALLRLDMDWVAPTVKALEELYPLLSKGGVLILDDYGHFIEQRKAVDEYLADKVVKLHRIDYSARSGVKP